jgi:hypothetical protein
MSYFVIRGSAAMAALQAARSEGMRVGATVGGEFA